MAKRTRVPDAAVTGVATGNLGTGTALDDTQVYSVDTFATADHPDAPQAQPVTNSAPAAPADVAVRPAPTRRIRGPRRLTGGYPVGILTAAVVALIAVAAVFTMRDGGLVGGAGSGPGSAGAASFPPAPSFGPAQTAVPEATPPPKHHGHGHGQNSQ
jgi:hypothetical protein